MLTYLCNLRCKHCYALDGDTSLAVTRPDVLGGPNGALPRLLTRLRAMHGTERLSLTGGEVLLPECEPYTLALTRHARDLGMDVRIITNGTMLTPERIRRLVEAAGGSSALILQVSVDSEDPVVHDTFRGAPGAWIKTIRGIYAALEHGIAVHARYSIREREVEDVVATYKLMSKIGIDTFVVKPVFQSGRARAHQGLAAGYETVREAQRRLAEASCTTPTPVKMAQPIFIGPADLPPGARVQLTECNCGKAGVTIDQQGNVLPCNFVAGLSSAADWRLGNILDPEFDLATIWKSEQTFRWYRSAACRGTCPSYALMEEMNHDRREGASAG